MLHLSRPQEGKLLIAAEQRLTAGDAESAQKLAQQALEEKSEDPGRALFILAEVATRNSDMQGARDYFERALEVAHEPKVVAWSHIYLGRIFDLQEDRDHGYRPIPGGRRPRVRSCPRPKLRQNWDCRNRMSPTAVHNRAWRLRQESSIRNRTFNLDFAPKEKA